jgi:hypothetical protein
MAVDADDAGPGPHRHAQHLQLAASRARTVCRVGGQHPVEALDEQDSRGRRVDPPEVAAQRVVRDLAERACKLDARRAATDDHERHPLALRGLVALALRGLERDEDPAPDLGRVVDGLEARGERRPPVVAEVRERRARRDDERVVRDRAAVGEGRLAPIDVDPDCLAEQHRGVPLAPQHRAQRLGDLARRQRTRGDLVQQRLEEVVVLAVDERQVDTLVPPETARRVQPREAAADDQDAVEALGVAGGAARRMRGSRRPRHRPSGPSPRRP